MKCYCPDCAYAEYNEKTGMYYCGITGYEHSGSDSADCPHYNEK